MDKMLLISICLLSMLLLSYLRRKKYNVSIIKSMLLTVLVAIMGLLGTYMLYYIENGVWGGQSFFGAVLFFPVLLFPISLFFRISLPNLLAYFCPSGMAMLAIFKINCFVAGCCGGCVLWFTEQGIPIYFPSQLVEMGTAVIIMIALILIEQNEKLREKVYPICLVLYGAVRFCLNWFRWEKTPLIWFLPPGNFWGLVSIIIGVVWLLISRWKRTTAI